MLSSADAEFAAWELQQSPEQQLHNSQQVSALLAAAAAAAASTSSVSLPQAPAPATWPKRHLTLQRLYDNDARMGDVSDYSESEEYARALLSALASTTCPLTEIKLVRIPAIASLMPQLAFVLARLPLLESLTLLECDLTDSAVRTLALAIANHPTLRSLSLADNEHIGDAGIAALVSLLQPQSQPQPQRDGSSEQQSGSGSGGRSSSPGLTRLHVGRAAGCAMTHLSALLVSSGLAQPGCTLDRLEWTGLSASASGGDAAALASGLARSRSLTHLTLSSARVRGPALQRLVAALTAHPTISFFSIEDADAEDTRWTDEDLNTLQRIVQPAAAAAAAAAGSLDQAAVGSSSSCGVLSSLALRTHSTVITPAGLLSFAGALDQSTQLRTVEVRFVSSAVDAAKHYKEALDAIKRTVQRNCQMHSAATTCCSSANSSVSAAAAAAVPARSAAKSEQLRAFVIGAFAAAAWVYFKWM